MTTGLVNSFCSRRGRGTVAIRPEATPIPFSARRAAEAAFTPGERVEYRVVGGKAGVQALGVRKLAS